MKQMIIMRGVPGSGKSTYAKENFPHHEILSTDDFYMKDGKYNWDASKIRIAHQWNKDRCAKAIGLDLDIVIDNTNTLESEFEWYVSMANDNGYEITIIEFEPEYEMLDVYVERNTHNVPKEVIDKMIRRFKSNDWLDVEVSHLVTLVTED